MKIITTQNVPKRYRPHLALPHYRYVPGQGAKDEQRKDIPKFKLEKLNNEHWKDNDAYLYGIDLFNQGFYYEAHEVWEELWHFTGHNSTEGAFLKALIQWTAIHLKNKMNEIKPAERLQKSFQNKIEEIQKKITKTSWMGLDLNSFGKILSLHE